MKNKFKLSDLPVLIKSDRRFQIGLVVVLIIIFWPLIDPTKNNVRTGAPKLLVPKEGTGRTTAEESSQDLVTAFKGDLDNLDNRIDRIEKSVDEQSQSFKDFETRTATIFKKVLERVQENEGGRVGADTSLAPTDLPPDGGTAVSLESESLEKFGETEDPLAAPEPPLPGKVAFIGAGDSVRVQLLAGVNAPTDGTPYPVVFKLSGDVLGPDGSTLPLGEARLIAAAQGSLTDARALFRLTSMNIRLPDGRRKVIPVDGWIVGEDGIRGMSGILIDPIGKAIAGAGMVGALDGVGQAFASQNVTQQTGFNGTTTIVSGNALEFAAGRGVSGAAQAWGGIIRDRLELMVPVVQVLSGRDGTAVFAQSVSIADLYEALEDEDGQVVSLD